MRELLFRGKRTYNGKWVEGSLVVTSQCNAYIISTVEDKRDATVLVNQCSLNVDSETVGQYTGLTDKNGVRIFEGDIVKGIAYSVTKIGVIVWIDEIASFGVRYFKSVNSTAWENSSILRCTSMGKTDEFAAEIIGNIHDNPELLKGGGDNG